MAPDVRQGPYWDTPCGSVTDSRHHPATTVDKPVTGHFGQRSHESDPARDGAARPSHRQRHKSIVRSLSEAFVSTGGQLLPHDERMACFLVRSRPALPDTRYVPLGRPPPVQDLAVPTCALAAGTMLLFNLLQPLVTQYRTKRAIARARPAPLSGEVSQRQRSHVILPRRLRQAAPRVDRADPVRTSPGRQGSDDSH